MSAFLCFLGLLASQTAVASTRTVQFAGLTATAPEHDDTINLSKISDCRIVIANTGAQTQKVEGVGFIAYDPPSGQTIAAPGFTAPESSMRVHNGAGSPDADCLGATVANSNLIPPGAFCIFRLPFQPVTYDGFVSVCAGFIKVSDTTAQPGSLTAAGSISIHHELTVLGGVLSGAYFASPTHLRNDPVPAAVHQDSGFTLRQHTFNMNFYCSEACKFKAGADNPWCDQNCGYIPVIVNQPGGSYYVGAGSWLQTTAGLGINPPPVPNSQYNMTADVHFAGGMVYEMIQGPMISICSGNKAYYDMGGQDFSHSDSLDWGVAVKGNAAGAPPEALACNHRHGADDLYLGGSLTVPFTINGGSPF